MVKTLGLRALQAGVVLALLAALAALGHVPIGDPPHEAMVRIVGRMVAEKVKVCRDLTAEELAKVPQHMQAAGRRCEQSLLPYRLRVWVDDSRRIDLPVRPSGIRGDRPLYVQQDLLLPPGVHRLRVQFDPEALPEAASPSGGSGPAAQRTALSTQQEALAEAIRRGTRYELDRTLQWHAGQVVSVELNEQARLWEVRGEER